MHPSVTRHDALSELFPGVYFLQGSIQMRPGVRINRNMIVLAHEGELTLINSVRLNEAGLAALDQLGKVAALVRLGDFHGMDDAFYIERYQCDLWGQKGTRVYKRVPPTHFFADGDVGPVPHASYFAFSAPSCPEAALLLASYGLLITTDSLQFYGKQLRHFSLLAKTAFPFLGFHRGLNIGPMWLKGVTPKGGSLQSDFERLAALEFDALVGAHGDLMRTGAKAALCDELLRVFG